MASERGAGKLLERLEGRAFDSTEGIQDLETPCVVENLIDHLRIHFEPIEVFRRERVVDNSVCDFERQPGEEIKEYDQVRDAMLTAAPQVHVSRGGCSLATKTVRSVLYPSGRAQDEENEGEQGLEENEAFNDELEVEYQEAVAMMTIAKQRR